MIYLGDAFDVLPTLEAGSVQCCVTSPPYWGLRDYGHPAQLGLEKTPALYVERMVALFREVRRVLRDDGTLWLNIGDSYATSRPGSGGACVLAGAGPAMRSARYTSIKRCVSMMKPKDLVGMPWMLAFALRADGWYLRSEIIWSKPNPMPESVTDRPTKAHEQLFLLAKAARYHYDGDAIREPSAEMARDQSEKRRDARMNRGVQVAGVFGQTSKGIDAGQTATHVMRSNPAGRNKRSVWTIATQANPDAHFATFPEALVEPCIRAGCPVGGTVLDPFAGSGTVGVVCAKLQRPFIGIELNGDYCVMAERNVGAVAPLFGTPA